MIAALLLMSQAAMPPCNQEAAERGIQQEMNICAAHDFYEADAELNAQWRITREMMQERDRQWGDGHGNPEDGRPGFFEKLLEAQRAWITFRDAHCALEGYEARGGSLEPLLVSTCKTHLTKQRTQELRDLAGDN